MGAILVILGAIVIIPLLIMYSSFSWGYVATIFYGWFILPLFPDLPVFTWVQFAGIAFMLSCFIHHSPSNIKKEYKDDTSWWIAVIIAPWMTLLGGWIFHSIIN